MPPPASPLPPDLRVIAWPAFRVGQENPYTRLLYTALRETGVGVDDFSFRTALRGRYDLFHLHWPEHYVVSPNPLKAVVGTALLLALISWLRFRGTQVVWTIHNLASHNQLRPRLERRFWQAFTRRVDGVLALTPGGLHQALARYPALHAVPAAVVPHGVYRDAYPNAIAPAAARDRLGLAPDHAVVLFIGNVVHYKNVPALARAFRGLADSARLVVAGRFATAQDTAEVRAAAGDDPRILIHQGYVPGEDLQVYFQAADLVVLPFREIWNSGSVLLSLSFDRPVLVPGIGAMPELQEEFGVEWIRTYQGELTTAELRSALDWARRAGGRTRRLPAMEWEEIARRTRDAYTRILTPPVGPPTATA